MTKIYEGIVVAFNPLKQWGWIEGKEADYYFHQANCKRGYKPTLGEEVQFELGPSYVLGKPPQAINVRQIGGAEGVK